MRANGGDGPPGFLIFSYDHLILLANLIYQSNTGPPELNSDSLAPPEILLKLRHCVSEFFTTNAPDPPPLDPKLMFLCVSYYLGAFGTVWLPYEARCKTGRTSAKVYAMKSH